MSSSPGNSVTSLVHRLRKKDPEAAQLLWDCFYKRMAEVANRKLRYAPLDGSADKDDVAVSAFASFCAAAAGGRLPGIADRDDLWDLLFTITTRKAVDLINRQARQKRGGGRVFGGAELDQFEGKELDLTFANMLVDEYLVFLERLDHAEGRELRLREIASLKLEGYFNQEIANRLGCSLRSVTFRLKIIRLELESLM